MQLILDITSDNEVEIVSNKLKIIVLAFQFPRNLLDPYIHLI